MSAEGHLTNPALFAGINPPVWKMGIEYLDLVDIFPCPISYVRGHLFKMLHHLLQIKDNFDLREIIAKSSSLADFRSVVETLQTRYQDYHDGVKTWEKPEELSVYNLIHPPWICQPYVRPSPESYVKKMEDLAAAAQAAQAAERLKRRSSSPSAASGDTTESTAGLSKRKLKKLERYPKKKFLPSFRENGKICVSCKNPGGVKCEWEMCKTCCKSKCFTMELDCSGHQIWIKSKRERARTFQQEAATATQS